MNKSIFNARAAEQILKLNPFTVIELKAGKKTTVAKVRESLKSDKINDVEIDNQLFYKHFKNSRREAGKNLDIKIHQSKNVFLIKEKDNQKSYQIPLQPKAIPCNCADYKQQTTNQMAYPICAHGYKILTHLGYTKFSDYLNA